VKKCLNLKDDIGLTSALSHLLTLNLMLAAKYERKLNENALYRFLFIPLVRYDTRCLRAADKVADIQ
jgi:hypothetical protein